MASVKRVELRSLVRRCVAVLAIACTSCIVQTAPTAKAQPRLSVASSPTFDPAVFARIAIYVTDATRRIQDRVGTLRVVEDALLATVMSKGYSVAARSDLDKIVAEIRLDRAQITEAARRDRVRGAGSAAILVGAVTGLHVENDQGIRRAGGGYLKSSSGRPRYQGKAIVSLRLVDAENGELLWSASAVDEYALGDRRELSAHVLHLSRFVAMQMPAKASGVGGAVADGVPATATSGTGSVDFDPAIHNRIAVYIEDRTRRLDQREGSLRAVEDVFLRSSLVRGYTVTARSDLALIRNEIEYQTNNSIDEVLARAKRVLGVPAVLIVGIDQMSTQRGRRLPVPGYEFDMSATISARLVSTEGAKVLWVSSYEASRTSLNKIDEWELLLDAAANLAGRMPRVR